MTWPEGYVCRRCYQQATRRHGSCPGSGQQRLLPRLDPGQAPICADCASIQQNLHCSRCDREDEPHRRGLCAACCLRDDLTLLLDDGHGEVWTELRGLLEALCAQQHPRAP